MTGPNNSKGLTLLELIAVLVIFSLVALGMIALTPAIQQMGQHSDQPEEWLHQARSCAEAVIARGDENNSLDTTECEDLCGELEEYCEDMCESDPDDESDPDISYCRIVISGDQDYESIVIFLPRE